MKARDTRQNAIIAARVRDGNTWCDAHILNLSSRGLLLHAAPPPSRGTYVEVRRGAHVIVAKVIWAEDDRFGVQTQDPLAVSSLVGNDSLDSAAEGGEQALERRARHRAELLEWRHARSRDWAAHLSSPGSSGSVSSSR